MINQLKYFVDITRY